MKPRLPFILLASLMPLLSSCHSSSTVELFNGKDLSDWVVYTESGDVEPSSLFRAEDGMIYNAGVPNGYLRTKEIYGNFKLHLEWRWVDQPVNSGVLLHVQEPDRLWPLSVECQLQHGNAGDIVLIGEGAGITVNDSTYAVSPGGSQFLVIGKMEGSSENPPGGWNSYDITCNEGNLELIVNGVLQNRGSGLTLGPGYILLQSEGAAMQFRNLKLTAAGG
jgi:hypothetical protein